MPPLPSTAQSLTNRLNTLSESNKALLQLVQRLSKLDFQPGSVPLSSEEGDVRLELSAEIHESLKQLEDELELLRQEVEDVVQGTGVNSRRRDSVRESGKSRLAVLLARVSEDLKSSRSQFRKAQLTAKRNADHAKAKERELLFSNLQSGSPTPSSTHRRRTANSQLSADELIVGTASDVTAGLRRTHQLMQTELSRSRFAQETLEQSTAALADLGEKYTDLNTLLANSKTLVNTLLKSRKSDTWYLETAFYILITTIVWLIFRRWLYGPLWWFVWIPLKLLYKFTFAVFAVVGLTSGNSSVSVQEQASTSLIVKPSASGGIPKRIIDSNEPPHYVRVGGGGRGWGYDPSPPESVSQQVGQMAEQDQQHQDVEEHPQLRERGQQAEEDNLPVVRGDGTVLHESDKPRNPKKRIWEENVESAKQEQTDSEKVEQAIGQGQEEKQSGGHRKRDEL
ncbi:Sec20-domain-containing protein [Lindgomyces ingoldianus]|uniref:Sec20-domain-containing protein n=1 Tax=Lindgomyces ingoldianus TaxID=673940 RepID=A0ACB6QPQ4_9PLEO|nr:Sec20-domain-containing protein [Lindgomyces ingoldianus]KAF2468095.1 Sec20-domain-containing protein [Lindgomyces ingoldianus]